MSDLVELLRKEADAADEKSIKLREAIEALGVISAYKELGFPGTDKPVKRRGRPPSTGQRLISAVKNARAGVLLKDIPVKASKKKGKKRKYTKRSTFWKKKK